MLMRAVQFCLVKYMSLIVMNNKNSIIIRALAGEGGFAILKKKSFLVRVIWFVKVVLKLSFMLAKVSRKVNVKDLVYICGLNQERLLKSLDLKLYGIGDGYGLIKQPKSLFRNNKGGFISIDCPSYFRLVSLCFIYMVTGSRKHVSLFLISYYRSVTFILDNSDLNFERFICFNDQPFEAAALTLWARFKGKKTIVLQHGVILSYDYYFPTNSHEFWAWGKNGRVYFRSNLKNGLYIEKGRHLIDKKKIPDGFVLPHIENAKGVICPSFYLSEVISFIRLASSLKDGYAEIFLKLHPATKCKFLFRLVIWLYGVSWLDYKKPILDVAENYDFLITKNSSSAVDFLLLGKPVFGVGTQPFHYDIFKGSFFSENEMRCLIYSGLLPRIDGLNEKRTAFIRDCIGDSQ